MGKLKQAIDQTYLNQDRILQSILNTEELKTRFKFSWMIPVMSLAMLLLIFFNANPITVVGGILSPNQVRAYAVVSVDVNPSFEFFTDMDQNVVDIKMLNNEAKQFDTTNWLNSNITLVLDNVIEQAIALGYMNLEDTLNDVIVVSSVSFGADNQALLSNVQQELYLNKNLNSTVKTYVIEADEDDFKNSEEQQISLGLYMVNRTISINGEVMSISEFMKNSTYMDQLEEIAEHQNDDQLKDIINALLIETESAGIDVSAYRARLNTEGVDLEDLFEDIKDLYHHHGPDYDGDDDDMIILEDGSIHYLDQSDIPNSQDEDDDDDHEKDEDDEEEDD